MKAPRRINRLPAVARAFIDDALAQFDEPAPIKRDVIAVKHRGEGRGLFSADP